MASAAAAGVVAALFIRDALAAQASFRAAMADLPAVEQALLDGDLERFDELVAGLQEHTGAARASTDGPLWWLASRIPVAGSNAAALTLVAEVVDDIAVEVLPQLATSGAILADGGLQVSGGRIDLDPIREAGASLAAAHSVIVGADDKLHEFDTANLVGEIAGPFDQAVARTSELRTAVTTGHDITALLPPMLGGDGPRQYLVLAQNNAELRSTGGIPGALLLISADDGVITMERQASAAEIGPFAEPVLELRPGDVEMFGENPGRFIQDVTLTPQFPVAAELAAQMWRRSHGETVDGVMAVDAVALSFLLEQIGPIEVEGGATLDASNVVQVLLAEVYLQYTESEDSDAVFTLAAQAVVERVLTGGADAAALFSAITRAGEEGRLLIWSAHPDEQERLASGSFGSDFDAATTAVGIFLNDATRSKMSYYFDTETTLIASSCTDAGRIDTVELRLTSTLTEEMAQRLPSYVTGIDLPPELWGTSRTSIGFYSAVDGQVIDIRRDDVAIGGQRYTIDGRDITVITHDLAPGESVVFQVSFLAAPGDKVGLTELWSSPTWEASGRYRIEPTYCQ